MGVGLIAAALAGANMIGGFFSNRQSNKMSKQIADERNAFDERMWHLKNAYDAPDQQMLRLKAAGLNPNLVYGSGGIAGNSGPPVKSADYEQKSPLSGIHLPDILSIIQTVSEVDKNKSEAMLKDSQRDYTDTNRLFQETLIKYGMPEYKAGLTHLDFLEKNETWKTKVDMLRQQFKKAGIEMDSAQMNNEMLKLNLDMNKELKEFNLNTNDSLISRLLVNALNALRGK